MRLPSDLSQLTHDELTQLADRRVVESWHA